MAGTECDDVDVVFRDRTDAGRRLAGLLRPLPDEPTVVLGLARGGVPVAFEVARALGAPLDVVVVRKLGVPFQPELAMGAVGEDGVRVLDPEVLSIAGISLARLEAVEQDERAQLQHQLDRFRPGHPRVPVTGATAVLVDDGIATGATVRAACRVVRAHGAARVVVAVPVAPGPSVVSLAEVADRVVCLQTPEPFVGVGRWYRDFSPTTDDRVVALLAQAAEIDGPPGPAAAPDPG